MNGDEYQRLALRTEYTPDVINHVSAELDKLGMSRLIHGMIGVCTEAGELQDMVKKFLIYNKRFDPVNVLEECGDLLWYISLTLDSCGFTMDECMRRNIEKLRKRYPDKFSFDAANNRDLDAERAVLEGK
jgi:NTP pyrophosphatase (non-canonical NTP hydrolase)